MAAATQNEFLNQDRGSANELGTNGKGTPKAQVRNAHFGERCATLCCGTDQEYLPKETVHDKGEARATRKIRMPTDLVISFFITTRLQVKVLSNKGKHLQIFTLVLHSLSTGSADAAS